MSSQNNKNRHFLFLQGVCSPFFTRLAKQLTDRGFYVSKINFNVGDMVYWWENNAKKFRAPLSELPDFLEDIYQKEGITDQIVFGDRRPVHRPAITKAEHWGIRTHVFEEGYFRPYWITLEREGVNGHSLLPRDPDWFWCVGGDLEDVEPYQPFSSSFAYRALHDVIYHVAGIGNSLLFPRYQTHAPVNAAIEYLGYSRRLPFLRLHHRKDNALIQKLITSGSSYFVLPLQLNSDAQIRDHSRFSGMLEVIDYALSSFAYCASPDTQIVIKNHPLDMGLINYRSYVHERTRLYGLTGRVHYMETGNLDLLVSKAQGTVTVNSTVGCFALGMGCPVVTLSDPIYNLPGLTFQEGIDSFWQGHEPPHPELFRRFRNTVMFATQINGGFYCCQGLNLAVKNSADVLANEISPLSLLLAAGA